MQPNAESARRSPSHRPETPEYGLFPGVPPDGMPDCFHQACTACGRRLRILAAYLGRQVACQHCGCRLIAVDPASPPQNENVSCDGPSALERADRLLAQCSGDDGVLRVRILRSLRGQGIDGLGNLHVEVCRGKVTLRGVVGSFRDRWLCRSRTRRVFGVIDVDDQLIVNNLGNLHAPDRDLDAQPGR